MSAGGCRTCWPSTGGWLSVQRPPMASERRRFIAGSASYASPRSRDSRVDRPGALADIRRPRWPPVLANRAIPRSSGPGRASDAMKSDARLVGGGMGIVFEAFDPRLTRRIALKVLLPEAVTVDAVERFLQEGKNASRLAHDNIVRIFDVGEAEGHPFLVMEYLEGQQLAERLRLAPGRRLSVREALDLLLPVFDAVANAHDAQIIHRDLKPENILLVQRSGGIKAVVLDFGIAKATNPEAGAEHSRTVTGQIVGTPSYMSPEQARGAKDLVGSATDQYALGVILYESVSGCHPMGRDMDRLDILQILTRIAYAPPDPLLRLVPEAGEAVAAAVERMLAKQPNDRYPGLRDAAAALGRARDAMAAGKPSAPPSTARTQPMVPTSPTEMEPPPPTGLPSPTIVQEGPAVAVADGSSSVATGPAVPSPGRWRRLSIVGVGLLTAAGLYALRPKPPVDRPPFARAPTAGTPAPDVEPRGEPTPGPTPAAAAPAVETREPAPTPPDVASKPSTGDPIRSTPARVVRRHRAPAFGRPGGVATSPSGPLTASPAAAAPSQLPAIPATDGDLAAAPRPSIPKPVRRPNGAPRIED